MSLARSSQWPVDKEQARNAILGWRKSLSPKQRDALTQKISVKLETRLKADLAGKVGPQCLGVYWPIRNEPDLRQMYASLARMQIDLALPVTPTAPGPLIFFRWSPGEEMQKDSMGIQTPSSQHLVVPDALLIPCVGYGPNNIRLGYGGGYYDRTLVDFSGSTFGVAFSQTFLPALIAQPFDIGLQEIVTELELA